ncbi:MAG TPA: hypothetical protein VMT20_00720 [Terriglobia bacterium]|nr:hypothetical protein [Terriglobia bacterium]
MQVSPVALRLFQELKGAGPRTSPALHLLAALTAGIVVALVGLVVPQLRVLYDYAWFVGFGVSFLVYSALRPAGSDRQSPTRTVTQIDTGLRTGP